MSEALYENTIERECASKCGDSFPLCGPHDSRMFCDACLKGIEWAAKMARIPPHDNPYNPKPETCDCPTCTVKPEPEPEKPCVDCGKPGMAHVLFKNGTTRWLCSACWRGEHVKSEPEKPLRCPTCTCAALNRQVETLAQMMKTALEIQGREKA